MRRLLSFISIVIALAAAGTGNAQTITSETQFTVKLLGPLDTTTNRAGDKITAMVVSPEAFKGDMMEGEVKKSKSSGKMNGKSVLNFTFQTLHHGNKDIAIQSQVLTAYNSKGQANVDEEGQVIEKKNNWGKAAIGTAIGAGLGALLGGAKGAGIGAGAGLAATLIFIEVGTKGPKISFAPGSEFILSVKEMSEKTAQNSQQN
jgi:hypothetical protein